MTVDSVVAELRKKGNENYRKIYARHGMDPERLLGVSAADMKTVAKGLKGKQELALELYATGIMEAMYLAGMVASGAKMTEAELQAWAEGAAGLQMISEYTVPWVAVEHPQGRALAVKWMGSKEESIAASGWCTYGGLVATMPNEELDLEEIQKLLGSVAKGMGKAKDRVRYTMNGFVIAVARYVPELVERASEVARAVGEVKVNMGETACKVPLALAEIQKAGGGDKKKKTLRC